MESKPPGLYLIPIGPEGDEAGAFVLYASKDIDRAVVERIRAQLFAKGVRAVAVEEIEEGGIRRLH